MATIYVKRITLNGKDLNDINGKRVREINVNGNTYYLPRFYTIVINTNNDDSDSATWVLPEDTYVNVSGSNISCTDVFGEYHSIDAGTKTNYVFDNWSSGSFYVNSDLIITANWTYSPPYPYSAEVEITYDNYGTYASFTASISSSVIPSNYTLSFSNTTPSQSTFSDTLNLDPDLGGRGRIYLYLWEDGTSDYQASPNNPREIQFEYGDIGSGTTTRTFYFNAP